MSTAYISCACNRAPHSADWGKNNLVCYGARNAIALYDPAASKTGKVLLTLHEHSEQVTVVRWIRGRNGESETELISGSNDGKAIIWTQYKRTYKPSATLKNAGAVRIASAKYISESNSKLLICTGNVDGELKLWERNEGGATNCVETIKFGKKLPIEASLSFLPGSNVPLVAVAMEDSTIQLICQDIGNEEIRFIKVQSLVGHEDWVRCLDFTSDNNGDVLLASGSQDGMIRLWKISLDKEEIADNELLRQKKEQFSIAGTEYKVALESILISHEGWVYGVNWHPPEYSDGICYQPMKLLSCSLDKTMILWEPDSSSGIWFESVRVGDVGGNSLGFYGCKFGPGGKSLLAHGYQGSFHIWEQLKNGGNWAPRSAPSGHFSEVVDLCWDPKGRFLLTTSLDQTTRVHAPWKDKFGETWHEIGRPQVHGYDIFCIALLTPYIFASGAEEKVVRTFTAPATFINYLKKLSNADDFAGSMAESASVPALGLTNKAVFDGETDSGENLYVGNSKDLNFDKPPTEEELIQHTLWPELQKLYGHGYELFSMAARHDGSLLATSCKSSSAEHSAIILWDTKTWKIRQKLMSHQLTVTQLEFSPNDEHLLSVSRDRRWSLFTNDQGDYKITAASSKRDSLHSRIIWCCAWSHDSKYFATGSRDGKIGIWSPEKFTSKEYLPVASIDIKNVSVTALAFARISLEQDSYVLAIGFESGNIELKKIIIKESSEVITKWETLDTSSAHHLTVKRLSFRPTQDDLQTEILQLASCGSDNTVKIHNIYLKNLSDL